MFVQYVSEEAEGVWEPLRASTLPDTDYTVLLRVEDSTLSTQEWECGLHQCTNPLILTCFPIGSGLVTVVLKNPSHSSRPYSPAQ